ncbi:MAG: hypothetical protein ACOVO2_05250 [Emticicia sp.]|uniref:hypothetical protein n=1 Tax=Emticicia sp. TaxID=1930953 RepID=UPI003BA78E42
MKRVILYLLGCYLFISSCKKESTNPAKYPLKSYTILANQFNISNVRDSVLLEYNNGLIIRATSHYKYDLNSIGPVKSLNFVYNKNKIQSVSSIKNNTSSTITVEYDSDNLLKSIVSPNSTFSIRYNTALKVSGIRFSFSSFYDFEVKNENMVSINRSGNIQKNEFDTTNNPFYYLPDDVKLIIMSEFGNSIFLNYYNGFSKNSLKSYSQDKKDYIISYKYNKANLPVEAIITSNSQKINTLKFYY